jgi:hypothetical protein
MTATMFFDVLQMSVDTVLMCYIADEEANDGKAIFAGAKMSDFVSEHGTMNEEEAKGTASCCGSKAGSATSDGDVNLTGVAEPKTGA